MDPLATLRQFSTQPATSVAEKIVWYDQVKPQIEKILSIGREQIAENEDLRASLKARELETENLKARIDMLQSELGEARGKLAEQQPTIAALNDAVWRAIRALSDWQSADVAPADKSNPLLEAEEIARLRGALSRRDMEVVNLTNRLGMLQSENSQLVARYDAQQPTVDKLSASVWKAIKTLEAVRKT